MRHRSVLFQAGLDSKDDPVTQNQSERVSGQLMDLDQLGQLILCFFSSNYRDLFCHCQLECVEND